MDNFKFNPDSLGSNSFKRKYLTSAVGFTNPFNNSVSNLPFDFGGRLYISHRSSIAQYNLPRITGIEVHEQSAGLANIGIDSISRSTSGEAGQLIEDFDSEYISSSPPVEIGGIGTKSKQKDNSNDPLSPLLESNSKNQFNSKKNYTDLESNPIRQVKDSKNQINQPSLLHSIIVQPIQYIPAVFLGTLLNILDGLSYGMIMFPISEAVFSSLAPAGLSMFYISCVVSQLIYSCGGSAFKAGIGSEMIEVTPFFHTMAWSILREMDGSSEDAIIATTITSYAVSALVTGLVFYGLGKCKLGSLVGFFPRHILVGCIGGVGYFLVITGIEVSSRLEGGISYNWETAKYLFTNGITLLQWTIPLGLAIILILIEMKYHNSLLVPIYFILVFVFFHLLVLVVPNWNLQMARDYGWVFPAVEGKLPWYSFYSLYKFNLVNWLSVLRQLPTMLALTFFGILHVPINVPALAVSVGMDQFDVDRELVAHGYSNFISGMVGSIQNYLVYTNSVLFIRAGGDERLAGIMLAVATAAVMVAGPVVIGYIPVCVVGALIYLLGYELLKESVYDTWGRLKKIDYVTIIIIVITMGAFDFVIGIIVGILLACLSFVVDAAKRPVIDGVYSGAVVRSTVLRHPKQQEFLKNVGHQICIIKLTGTVFFGSIGGVEKSIRARFEQDIFKADPIKFLIIDMKGVSSIDFSAAEGFRRILNLCNEFHTQLIYSSVEEDHAIIKALRDAGLWDNILDESPIELFSTLNFALEWCENSFLSTYTTVKNKHATNVPIGNSKQRLISASPLVSSKQLMLELGTPRITQVYKAAKRTVTDEHASQGKYFTSNDSLFKKQQPLPLIMTTFQGLSSKDEKFWSNITKYFVKEKIPENIEFYNTLRDKPSFFIVESGLINSTMKFEQEDREIKSSILSNTAFGDLIDSSNYRQISYTTVTDSVIWKLPYDNLSQLSTNEIGEELYTEISMIQTKLLRERFDTLTANLVISG